MVTALAELDPTLSDDAVIATQICILIATQDDGTPLDPTSFGEEDVIKLWIDLGQEHLEGVLWLETQPSPSESQPNDEPLLDLTWDIREFHLDQLGGCLGLSTWR